MNTLRKTETGRWAVSGRDLGCGDVVEVNVGPWLEGRIEHNGRDYIFLAGSKAVVMLLRPGLEARFPTARP